MRRTRIRALRWPFVVRRTGVRRRAADPLRPRHRRAAVRRSGAPSEFHGTVLLSHLHWDHVQGLPFFTPLHRQGATLDVFGPRQDEESLGDVFAQMMRPPFFPIVPDQLTGDVRFHGTGEDDFPVGSAKVRSRWVRHVGPTLGFRVELHGVSVAYIPDHGPGCHPDHSDDYIPHEVLELCDGVDVLIHDAQHTPAEYEPKRHWGHCTADYAVHVAREAGARRLGALPPRSRARRRRSRRDGARRGRLLRPRRRRRGDGGLRRTRDRARPRGAGIRMTSTRKEILAPDPAAIRTVLGHFATGVAIITAMDGDEPVGMACNSFTSVSLEPQLVLFCAAKASSTWPRIQAREEVGREHPGRGRRAGLSPVRGEGRRPLRAHRVHGGSHGRTDTRRRDRVRRLRDDRRARCRRPPHRRRPCRRARLRARGQAVALLPRRVRALRGLSVRQSALPAYPLGDVDAGCRGDDRDDRFADREQPADGPDPNTNARLATPRIAAASASWARTVDAATTGSAFGGAGAGEAGRDPPLVDPVQPVGLRADERGDREEQREPGNQPRDAKHEAAQQGHTHCALCHPIGPGVDPLDRLVHRGRLNRSPERATFRRQHAWTPITRRIMGLTIAPGSSRNAHD